MLWHRAIAIMSLAFLTSVWFAPKATAETCNGCNIVYDFGLGGVDIGQTYELFDGTRVVVLDVDYNYGSVLLQHADDYYGQSWWEAADRLYGVKTAEAPRSFDDDQYRGLVAACAAAEASRDDNFLMFMLMRRGCCESSAARAYPEVSDPVCR